MRKGSDFKVWKLPHPILLHWVLNPGLCINEVLLGQRVPKISLIDEASDAPLTERTYVECPHCNTIHNCKLWGVGNTFRHYQGLYCVACEEKIPTLLNIFSLLFLILLFPIWKPLQLIYGARFKAWELERLRTAQAGASDQSDKPVEKVSGVKMGLNFGLFMGLYFLVTNIVRDGFTVSAFALALVLGIFCGVFFGGIMSWFANRKGSKT